jgi:hypothetical protein
VISAGEALGFTAFALVVFVGAAGFAWHFPDAPADTAGLSAAVSCALVWMLMSNDPLDRGLAMATVAVPWAIAGALMGTLGARRDAG